MATYTIYSGTSDGRVYSGSTTYSTARAGSSGASFIVTANLTNDLNIGQVLGPGVDSNYYCYEGFVQFDTSTVGGRVTSATLDLYGNTDWDTLNNWTLNARLYDWGTAIESGDYVAGADLSSKTLLATYATSGFTTSGYNTFTSEAAFLTNVNQSGSTRLVISSSRHEAGSTPTPKPSSGGGTGDERLFFQTADTSGTSQDPKLTVVTDDSPIFANMPPRIPAEAY